MRLILSTSIRYEINTAMACPFGLGNTQVSVGTVLEYYTNHWIVSVYYPMVISQMFLITSFNSTKNLSINS